MANKDKKNVEEYEYRAEMKQLLNLIIHSLYTHPEIFLRELISNASDALNKVRFLMLTDKNIVDPDAELKIKIEVDSKKQTFSIEDTGIGMTKEELINEIGTVAKSGTLEFMQKIKEQNKTVDGNWIGQFRLTVGYPAKEAHLPSRKSTGKNGERKSTSNSKTKRKNSLMNSG